MKATRLRELTDDELRHSLEETRRGIFDFRAKRGIGETTQHPLEIRNLKRNLARIKTILRERRLA